MSSMNSAMPEPNQDWDEDQHEKFLILKAFLTTIHHFFGDFDALFQTVDDPRRPELITYPLAALAFAGVGRAQTTEEIVANSNVRGGIAVVLGDQDNKRFFSKSSNPAGTQQHIDE